MKKTAVAKVNKKALKAIGKGATIGGAMGKAIKGIKKLKPTMGKTIGSAMRRGASNGSLKKLPKNIW